MKKWEKEEIEELRSMSDKKNLSFLASYFHTTTKEIEKMIQKENMIPYKTNRWTKEEVSFLEENAKTMVTKDIANHLGKSLVAVQKKALKLGIKVSYELDPFEDWMIDYLRENINQIPISKIEKKLGISYHKILKKCEEEGIPYRKESWTEEEIAILREYADKCHYTELTKVLPNRTVGAIGAKAYELGIKTISEYHKLNEKEAKYVKENWGKKEAQEIARDLNVSISVIYRYKKALNLPNLPTYKKWTDEVILKLKKDAKTKTKKELAKKYHTTEQQISILSTRYNIEFVGKKHYTSSEIEDDILSLKVSDYTLDELMSTLGVSKEVVMYRLRKLGINNYKKTKRPLQKWREEEIDLLRSLSKTDTIKEIAKKLNKTEKQVYEKAKRMNIELTVKDSYFWTEEELERLYELSKTHLRHEIAEILNKTEASVKEKGVELGIKFKIRERKHWTKGEEVLLKELAPSYTVKEIAPMLNRSEASVLGKLKVLNIHAKASSKFWTEEELDLLKKEGAHLTVDELSNKLGRSFSSTCCKLHELHILPIYKDYHPWSKEEIETLITLLPKYNAKEIASMLGRSEMAVKEKAHKLNRDELLIQKKWTEKEEELLSDLWGEKPIEYISEKLNRTQNAIMNRASLLELGPQLENNYLGITIPELVDLFKVTHVTILINWVNLGLKVKNHKRSSGSSYFYVTTKDLLTFLKENQEVWDASYLEENILGMEEDWLKEKRRNDFQKRDDFPKQKSISLKKQQLINAKKYYLDNKKK